MSSTAELSSTAGTESSAAVPNVVILAAGLGTRLARPHPKPLTPLADGRTILHRQLDHVRGAFGADVRVCVVVGFKMDAVMEAVPNDATFVYNELFDQTNTAKSLLKALRLAPPGGVLWLNGDVVFAPGLLESLRPHIERGLSFVAVNRLSVGDEEIKYTLDADGFVVELSKRVVGGLGEAVGINYISAAHRPLLIKHLAACADNDYFERGLELAIAADRLRLNAVDISAFDCVEVDFADDLERARRMALTAGVANVAGAGNGIAKRVAVPSQVTLSA
ncbi:MAG TPA: phosphocholine cytidylyltransferase family protein [Micromonosporaceae bacterium]|jgi:CDP-glycerol glycerophosphotransferase|nr:phosphocholine cytidylyltransferase family protein [Micromonosporaceae bacterium]